MDALHIEVLALEAGLKTSKAAGSFTGWVIGRCQQRMVWTMRWS